MRGCDAAMADMWTPHATYYLLLHECTVLDNDVHNLCDAVQDVLTEALGIATTKVDIHAHTAATLVGKETA